MLLDLYVKAKTLLWGARDKITNEDGAVATEYGLLLVLIAIAIVAAATALGLAIAGVFDRGTGSLSGVGN
jgi:Flp pilus assembly pilin Flp